ncbi:uncharacterized protein GGS25DRAFT_481442 [Hypoxylon fragiforme]|uniref:uncharacterized protein n=1 Tax=Hypoxylon fragiforme TaxID=63214 RepID=UPI0020C673A2|nr:uncharacterized protein GGS25DRAFT_481442 [Hypoxylon fragiforme]KAI2611113.1 hypothetical protein GGS25DRAFT_481442 [Hypoxylon fragiforme]
MYPTYVGVSLCMFVCTYVADLGLLLESLHTDLVPYPSAAAGSISRFPSILIPSVRVPLGWVLILPRSVGRQWV